MFFLKRKTPEGRTESDMFTYTSGYITDELELIHDQQDNLVRVSHELDKAFSQAENMKKLLKIVKKVDKTMLRHMVDKRKEESGMINLIEEIKRLVEHERYEDIERLMLQVQQKSQFKIKLSQEELNMLREFMEQIDELYKEASGLCRLYQLVFSNIKQVHDKCEYELRTETTEEAELNRAGVYTEHIH